MTTVGLLMYSKVVPNWVLVILNAAAPNAHGIVNIVLW